MILRKLAHIINDNIRIGDYSARLGGDEFAVWLDEITEKDALLKAHNFVIAGSQLAHLADVEGPQLSISIGVAMSNPDLEQTFDDLMENADKALYQAKAKGKASCVMYNPGDEDPNDNDTSGQGQEREPNA